MPDPLVVRVTREFKAQLLIREQAQMQAMAGRWLDIERLLDGQISALAADFEQRRLAGQAISEAALFRMERFQSLLRQLERELETYQEYADDRIATGQRENARLGIEHAARKINTQMAGVGTAFDMLPVEAVENMVGLASDGSPLARLLRQSYPDAAEGIMANLVRGTALGWNPNRTARAMRDGMAQGLNRTLTIARTEQLRVYREASRQQYEASGVVPYHRRIATHDDRVCAACLMAEGEVLEVGEQLYDHPQGRCDSVPAVSGLPAVQWQLGPDWFREQGEATQRAILGSGRYRAWREGRFDLDQLVTVRHDDTWGRSLNPTPLQELLATA